MSSPQSVDTRGGFLAAFSAYFLWGFFPLFLRQLDHVPAFEVVLHRVIWALPFTMIVLLFLGRTADAWRIFEQPRNLAIMFLCACVISINWGLFVWAIAVDRTIETALGYYINPLVTVAMAGIFLKERFDRLQLAAIGLATVAVLILTFVGGTFPWLSLVLALSFATYGFIKKTVPIGPTQGFLVEVYLVTLLAIPVLMWLIVNRQASFLTNTYDTLMLIAAGPITAIPLILFATGAKGLRLSTLGIMQYIAPTGIFLTGVFIFKEPFGIAQLIAFVLIWTALALYSWSAFVKSR